MFEKFSQLQTYSERFNYVASELVAAANAGELSITKLYTDHPDVVDVAGQVILGHYIDAKESKYTTGHELPHELSAYRVRVAMNPDYSGNIDTVRFRRPAHPGGYMRGAPDTSTDGRAVGKTLVDTGKADVDLSLPDAWRALRQAGKHCLRIRGGQKQKRNWAFVELPREVATEPPKKKRGRPPKKKQPETAESPPAG